MAVLRQLKAFEQWLLFLVKFSVLLSAAFKALDNYVGPAFFKGCNFGMSSHVRQGALYPSPLVGGNVLCVRAPCTLPLQRATVVCSCACRKPGWVGGEQTIDAALYKCEPLSQNGYSVTLCWSIIAPHCAPSIPLYSSLGPGRCTRARSPFIPP